MEKTFEELVNEAVRELPFFKRFVARRLAKMRPESFYSAIAIHVDDDALPNAQPKFAACSDSNGLRQTSFEVDPENLQKILDFLKYLVEKLLPILLELI